jgi:hypothetical protein
MPDAEGVCGALTMAFRQRFIYSLPKRYDRVALLQIVYRIKTMKYIWVSLFMKDSNSLGGRLKFRRRTK